VVSLLSTAPVGAALPHTLHGHCGTFGVTEFDCDDAGPAPTAFVAETVKV
jgi:hypothetical protein